MNQLVPRHQPLEPAALDKLEEIAAKHFVVREKTVQKRVPVTDDLGNVYRWEFDLVPEGVEIFIHGEPDQKLLDAVNRPATKPLIMAHLSKLSAHKRYTQGEAGLQIVITDIASHLEGVSEYALVKVLRDLQLDPSPFWPDTGTIVARVRDFSDQLRWATESRGKAPEKPRDDKPEPFVKPELAHRQRVVAISAALLSGKALEELPEEDQVFWKEIRKNA
jgi:hypothetical protein